MKDPQKYLEEKVEQLLEKLNQNKNFDDFDDVSLFRLMSGAAALRAANLVERSTAQLRQDILAATIHGFKRDGFFVEIGATDGVYLSNTRMLEEEFGWNGILAEPAKFWHEKLAQTRSVHIDTRCVHSTTGDTVTFQEVAGDKALSTISEFAEADFHSSSRKDSLQYQVQTVSLRDLLLEYGAPEHVDFLSIDTEGSEFEILNSFDFQRFSFGVIACEHNFSASRSKIYNLLSGNGYIRILEDVSHFDDWYIHNSFLEGVTASMPKWQSASLQGHTAGERALTQSEQTIKLLQETVENLILERDAFKGAASENLETIELLQKTVLDLIADRDAYKAEVENRHI